MAMTNCPKHQLQGGCHICPHIFEAIETDRKIKFTLIVDELYGGLWVCDDCNNFVNNNNSEDLYNNFLDNICPMCWRCFVEWSGSNTLEEDISIFNEWLQLVKKVVDKLPNSNTLTCPKCNTSKIDFQYVGNATTRFGYLDVWCNACLYGIHIIRVTAPTNATMISFEESEEIIKRIPNFVQVTP